MRTEIHFTHMDRSETLEVEASDRITEVIEEFLNRDDCHTQIWLIKEHSPFGKGKPEFKCEVSVRYPPKKEVFVHKSHEDMHHAIHMTATALQGVLREESKREINRRHEPARG